MKDVALALTIMALLWTMLSWASGGAVLADEHARRTAAEDQVATQSTRIAILTDPTLITLCGTRTC